MGIRWINIPLLVSINTHIFFYMCAQKAYNLNVLEESIYCIMIQMTITSSNKRYFKSYMVRYLMIELKITAHILYPNPHWVNDSAYIILNTQDNTAT